MLFFTVGLIRESGRIRFLLKGEENLFELACSLPEGVSRLSKLETASSNELIIFLEIRFYLAYLTFNMSKNRLSVLSEL